MIKPDQKNSAFYILVNVDHIKVNASRTLHYCYVNKGCIFNVFFHLLHLNKTNNSHPVLYVTQTLLVLLAGSIPVPP